MYLYGEFLDRVGRNIRVEILTYGDRSEAYEILDEKSGIWFPSDSPVTIDCEINDTFDHIIRHSATVRLESAIDLTGLYCRNCRDGVVNIYREGECLFAGFIEPQSYSQPFNDSTDEVEINCIDALSALQYSLYGGVGEISGRYDELKMNTTVKSFLELMIDSLEEGSRGMNISGKESLSILYDGSRKLFQRDSAPNIFSGIGLNELIFLGSNEDEVWTRQNVLEEIMKYLGLHVEQEGFRFYIYSWETAKRQTAPQWSVLSGNEASDSWKGSKARLLSKDNVADTGTNISIGESYNLISLTCDLKDMEDLVVSPLSEENLTSPYIRRQKYVTSITVNDGLPLGRTSDFIVAVIDNDYRDVYSEDGSIKDWYLRLRHNDRWMFNPSSDGKSDLYNRYCDDGRLRQELLPDSIGEKSLGAALISWGYAERTHPKGDNSPLPSMDMKDYFVVSVHGMKDFVTSDYETVLQAQAPLAVYKGKASGTLLSPADSEATNYIVISGSVLLTPIVGVNDSGNRGFESSGTIPPIEMEDGRKYHYRRWWKTETPNGNPYPDESGKKWLAPPDEGGKGLYEFTYSAIGDDADHVSKVGVLACMLIVGDKCLVENGTDGQVTDFEWRKYKKREECVSDDEFYAQTFTVGFDPKTGDKLIGTEFDIQNNITFDMGLDAEGMAIPIRESDMLSGEVQFRILGPVNIVWDTVTYRHRTWFRSAKWTSTSVQILKDIDNIYFKNFEIKLYSDKGLIDLDEECELIYMSDTDEKYVNKKDDITFRINSALNAEERNALGVSTELKISTAVNMSTGYGMDKIHSALRGEDGKPEQIYVDEAWREWHSPKVQMEQTMDEKAVALNRFDTIEHPALPGKRFFIQGISRNLITAEAKLNLKEIGDD